MQTRRGIRIVLAVVLWSWSLGATTAEAPPPSLLMLEFELIDEMRDLYPDGRSAPELGRLRLISEQLRAEFAQNGFYTVLDPVRGDAAIQRARDNYHYLHDCNGCELELARGVGAERVLTGWVQKVSNLILNINIEIKDTKSGDIVVRKSVDIRGNTDAIWQRGIAFLVRDMRDKQQGGR